jgi:hypothetical protein
MPQPERIKFLVMHITDSAWGTVESIRQWHTAEPPNGRGWADIGYHYILTNPFPTYETWYRKRPQIDWDGRVWPGRDIDRDGDVDEEIGAHALGFNGKSLGIALVGREGMFSSAQMRSAVSLCRDLSLKYMVPNQNIIGHNETGRTSKACPCLDMTHFRALVAGRTH